MRPFTRAFTALALLLTITLAGVACHRKPAVDQFGRGQDQWGSSYVTTSTSGQQQTMVPDHSWLTYFILYHLFFSNSGPTYHVYSSPVTSYPSTVTSRPSTGASPLTSGSTLPTASSPSYRSDGGFSRPSVSSSPSYRSGGGFTSPSSSSGSSFRSSGGFSSSGSSGGFRSGGGFSGGRR